MRSRASLIAAMLLRRGDVEAMLCGTVGTFDEHLAHVREVIGRRPGVLTFAAMNMLMLPNRQIFICDTYVNHNPRPEEIAELTLLAAEEVRRFGLTPVVALLSHSSFGSSNAPEAQLMREARSILVEHDPELVVDGEMRGDAALSKPILDDVFPGSPLATDANLLIMPSVDAANISYNLLKVAAGNGITVGPILLGTAKPVHILEPAVSVRRIVNMTALAVVDANTQRGW
jgi:malate dehydrogenase (oxaloacetate-decarboxylating)(NADP+)